jgi:ankyrin repeat protein
LNGQQVNVRKNLWRFLQQARSLSEPLFDYIWIDALCINQMNDSERTHQVALMGEIYTMAKRVIAWLGPAYDSSDSGVEEFRIASPQWTAKKTFLKKWKSPAASAIRSICVRSYWNRLWIFQELLLARQAVIMCGSRCIPLQAFRNFVLKISSYNISDHAADQFELQCVRESPAVNIMHYIAQRRTESSILDLMIVTRELRCSDIRDRVFAVLNVDASPTRTVSADYEKSIPYLINNVLRDHYSFQPPRGLDEITDKCRELAKIMNTELQDVFALEGEDSVWKKSTPMPVPILKLPSYYVSHTTSVEDLGKFLADEEFDTESLLEPYGGRLLGIPFTFSWAACWQHGAVVDLILKSGMINVHACLTEAIKRNHYAAVAVLLEASTARLRQQIDEPISQCANALQLAVAYDRVKIVELLIRAGANPNVRGSELNADRTEEVIFATNFALKIATINRSPALVALLLANGAKVDATCGPLGVGGGLTALGAALISRRKDTARLLLDAGADINLEFNSPLGPTIDMHRLVRAAVDHGAEAELRAVLQLCGHKYLPEMRPLGIYRAERGLLEQAVFLRHSGIVRLLLEYGVKVNGRDRQALSMAITIGEDDTAKLLLKHGADVNMLPFGPWEAPLCAAVGRRSEEMTKLLLEHGARPGLYQTHGANRSPTALHLAVDIKSEALVRLLLLYGADAEKLFKNRTPISKAIQYGHADIVRLLLQAGAPGTSSMLHEAIEKETTSERERIIALLLEHGADLNAKQGRSQRTALEEAVAVGNIRVVEILLRHKPTLQYSQLVTAVNSHNVAIVELLLQAGVRARHLSLYEYIGQVQEPAHSPSRSIDRGVPSDEEVIIQLLLDNGADLNAKDGRYKQTALELAIEERDVQAVDVLLRFKPRIELRTLERASTFGDYAPPAIMRLLIDHCARFGEGEKFRATVLELAARTGNLDALRSLLQSGTKVNFKTWLAVRKGWLGTDDRSRRAVLEMLHDHETATKASADSFLPALRAITSAVTARTGRRGPTVIGSEIK